jgi:hypothetical protein
VMTMRLRSDTRSATTELTNCFPRKAIGAVHVGGFQRLPHLIHRDKLPNCHPSAANANPLAPAVIV